MTRIPRPNGPCPCRSGAKYKKCCRPLHKGAEPPSAEALMRSRFCAYALGLVGYLMETTHPDGPNWNVDAVAWRADLAAWCAQTRFESLEIESTRDNPLTGESWVRFRAGLSGGGRDLSFVEESRFVRHEGRLKYIDGEIER